MAQIGAQQTIRFGKVFILEDKANGPVILAARVLGIDFLSGIGDGEQAFSLLVPNRIIADVVNERSTRGVGFESFGELGVRACKVLLLAAADATTVVTFGFVQSGDSGDVHPRFVLTAADNPRPAAIKFDKRLLGGKIPFLQ